MSKCKRCCKEFKYQWCLQRHLDRKMPCKEKVSNESINEANKSNNVTKVADESSDVAVESSKVATESSDIKINSNIKCKFCNKSFGRKVELKKHENSVCKEKNDHVRRLELMLNIQYPNNIKHTQCRFCNKIYSEKCGLTKHLKKCQEKQNYAETLEAKLKENQTKQQHITNNTINNNILLNVSAETLKKFGKEDTDHITNEYLRRVIGRLGVTLPKVVSTVAKKIYFDKNKPENQTVQITNVRSQWAKVSNGSDYELQPLGEAVSGVRNKVTDLYVERQCDYFDYFMKVNCRIYKLDNLNNQNYLARTLEDKDDQKNASKLKSEIDREVKSSIYNINKKNQITISK